MLSKVRGWWACRESYCKRLNKLKNRVLISGPVFLFTTRSVCDICVCQHPVFLNGILPQCMYLAVPPAFLRYLSNFYKTLERENGQMLIRTRYQLADNKSRVSEERAALIFQHSCMGTVYKILSYVNISPNPRIRPAGREQLTADSWAAE